MKPTRLLALGALLGATGLSGCQWAAPRPGAHTFHGHPETPEAMTATAPAATSTTVPPATAIDLSTLTDLDGLLPRLADRRVVYVGEQHDRYEHHLTQLEIIRQLHRRDPRIAIGVEFFQQPFQSDLDAYVSGAIDEQAMLEATEYYKRWRFDYRLYRPILNYARENGIPLIALNVPADVTETISQQGMEALSESQRRWLPAEVDRSSEAYRNRMRDIFERHSHDKLDSFEHFLEAQLTWDEGMAERAARFLREHPDTRLVVLAGAGHLFYGEGIPMRVARRLPAPHTVVLNGDVAGLVPRIADYMLIPEARELSKPGRLGVALESDEGSMRVGSFSPDSAAQAAGMRAGDVLKGLESREVRDLADVRLVLWDKRPDDEVRVVVRRRGILGGENDLEFTVRLR